MLLKVKCFNKKLFSNLELNAISYLIVSCN